MKLLKIKMNKIELLRTRDIRCLLAAAGKHQENRDVIKSNYSIDDIIDVVAY